ncbi:unnamed protein product [Cochlearia groenlandica]
MSRKRLYEDVDDDDDEEEEEEDDIGEDLEELRRACMVSDANPQEIAKIGSVGADYGGDGGGGGIQSDSEEEDDFEMLRSIKSQLESSKDVRSDPPLVVSSLPWDSENEDDDFEMLRSIKSQLSLSMDDCLRPMGLSDEEDDDDDDAFETLRAIRRRFSAYANFDPEGNLTNESPGKKKQVHDSDNEPSSKILSRSNTCESFPDSEEVQATHSVDLHENTATELFDELGTDQSSLQPSGSSSFPESAQAFVDAIRKNRSYQKVLRRKLSQIDAMIEQNEKHKKNVKIIMDFQASRKRITKQQLSQRKDPRVELISTRKSRPCDSSEGNSKKTPPLMLGPPENPCVANYRMALEIYPVSVERRNWSTDENENLAKGLKQQVQEALLGEAIERFSDLDGSADDIDTISESIKNLEITPEMIRQFLPKVNWDQLASMYLKDRSAAECEARWMTSEDPLINNGPWTAEEDNNLRLIIQENSVTDWLNIAVSLGTNRTPFQCLARYQRSLNANILRKEWTVEEDEKLRAAVELFGEKNWQSVANELEGRVGTQCSNRWKKTLHPSIKKKGKWSSEEDKRLKVAVTLFGPRNWLKIAQFVPGRIFSQCRERWENSLDPKIKREKWTEEEDAKLREGIAEFGHSRWSKIALRLPCRTDNQCRRRWKSLYPHQVAIVTEANKLRKEAIVGNFVDRESERPALLAGDLLALPGLSLELEPVVVTQKRKRKARQKKSDAERDKEASCATKRQPKKRRRKGTEKLSGDVCSRQEEHEAVCESNENNEGGEVEFLEWYNDEQDNAKQEQGRRRKSVAEQPTEISTVNTNCSQVIKVGPKKLKPRRKVSSIVPIENQDAPK